MAKPADATTTASNNVTFLALTDIHFNACHGLTEGGELDFKTIMEHLVRIDAADWPAYLRGKCGLPISVILGHCKDSNLSLLEAVLDRAQEVMPQPSFIIFAGDFLKHDIWELPKRAGLSDEEAKTFYRKSIEVVMQALLARWPEVPIFPTFGNDDSFVHDYALQYKGQLLSDLKPMMRKAIGPSVLSYDGEHAFSDTGSYSAWLPGLGHRLISLSNVFWSCVVGSKSCHYSPEPGASSVLAFLDTELRAAASKQERVWLLMHIPPGHTGYLKHGDFRVNNQWHEKVWLDFQKVIDAHDVPIDWVFFGHTHMNDYRILTHNRRGIAHPLIGKICPGVSPIFGQNPSFQAYSTSNSVVSGWTTHYYTESGAWGEFDDELPSCQPAELLTHFEKLRETGAGGDTYIKQFFSDFMPNVLKAQPIVRDFMTPVLENAPTHSAELKEHIEKAYKKLHVSLQMAMLLEEDSSH